MSKSLARIQQLLSSPNPVKWLFTGDSITQGVLHTYGGRDYTELFKEQVCFSLLRKHDVIINTAVNGCTSSDALNEFDWRVTQFAPDVLLVMLGMNDCAPSNEVTIEQFRDNLGQITQRARELNGCEVVLQTTCPIILESAAERAPYLANYMEVVREVAEEQSTILVDHTKYWEEQIAGNPLRRTAWMDDPFHPNATGHRSFAEFLIKELNILVPNGN